MFPPARQKKETCIKVRIIPHMYLNQDLALQTYCKECVCMEGTHDVKSASFLIKYISGKTHLWFHVRGEQPGDSDPIPSCPHASTAHCQAGDNVPVQGLSLNCSRPSPCSQPVLTTPARVLEIAASTGINLVNGT